MTTKQKVFFSIRALSPPSLASFLLDIIIFQARTENRYWETRTETVLGNKKLNKLEIITFSLKVLSF